MPMRGELTIPANLSNVSAAKHDVWPIVGLCLIGLTTIFYLATIHLQSFDQIPLLMTQYDLW
jgi:hypothetical protein